MATGAIPLAEPPHWAVGNTVEVLTAALLDGGPADAAGACRMLDQLRIGMYASAAAVWVVTDGRARRAALLVDNPARTATTAEIPVGIITSLIGVPVFAVLLRRMQSRGGWKSD